MIIIADHIAVVSLQIEVHCALPIMFQTYCCLLVFFREKGDFNLKSKFLNGFFRFDGCAKYGQSKEYNGFTPESYQTLTLRWAGYFEVGNWWCAHA
jgi:hypothetical protein